MAKLPLTLELEKRLENNLKLGEFGCPEVTIGFGGRERVDFLIMNTKEIVRCYEIKVSKADFKSSAKHTFVGHYNYFVMPEELFLQVKDEIPFHVGVTDGFKSFKKAKRQDLKIPLDIIKMSLIRSLSRDAEKFRRQRFKSNSELKKENEKLKDNNAFISAQNKFLKKYLTKIERNILSDNPDFNILKEDIKEMKIIRDHFI